VTFLKEKKREKRALGSTFKKVLLTFASSTGFYLLLLALKLIKLEK
jgi:hypothetical protein